MVLRSAPHCPTPGKSPREKHNIFDDAGKGFKTLGKNISKLKPKDKVRLADFFEISSALSADAIGL